MAAKKKTAPRNVKSTAPASATGRLTRRVTDNASSTLPIVELAWKVRDQPFTLKSIGGDSKKRIDAEALWWNYALLNRERWRHTDMFQLIQQDKAKELWSGLFVDSHDQQPLYQSDAFKWLLSPEAELPKVLEVSVRSRREAEHWAHRLIPWEFVTNAAIRAARPRELWDYNRVPVVRRWVGSTAKAAQPSMAIKRRSHKRWKVLVVLSAPGFISKLYRLHSEREILYRHFVGKDEAGKECPVSDTKLFVTLWSPSFEKLKRTIVEFEPDIVHFAGCDTHQAVAAAEDADDTAATPDTRWEQLYGKPGEAAGKESISRASTQGEQAPDNDGMERDGYVLLRDDSAMMHGDSARLNCVSYWKLPELFKSHAPSVVTWNIYHSGSRIAALAVGEGGVGASVGILDYIDDGLAEEYFDEFYAGLIASAGSPAIAHVRGLQALWRLPKGTQGAGIVCWIGGESCLNEFAKANPVQHRPTPLETSTSSPSIVDRSMLRFDISVPDGLNYAQLHQSQYPFNRFRIELDKPHIVKDLKIKVSLNGEDRELIYQSLVDVHAPYLDLQQAVDFPLTSTLARSCRESVVTTITVTIMHGDNLFHCNTYRTRILPADQWRFAKSSAHTLPSFIFPRDPAVEKLVLSAQRYVRALRDDAMAGFEGYQAADPNQIDLQVRALWYAIVHEYRLGYINPPPAYSRNSDSQRLRTPTMVLQGGWGTCIDLALLLASALELVDVYPVIFVLNGHAFVGYWRSVEGRESFLRVDQVTETADETWFRPRRPMNGMFMSTSLLEIRHHIGLGQLVPLEATLLTSAGSFDQAMSDGQANLNDPNDFEYMIDVMSARSAQITPLPLTNG